MPFAQSNIPRNELPYHGVTLALNAYLYFGSIIYISFKQYANFMFITWKIHKIKMSKISFEICQGVWKKMLLVSSPRLLLFRFLFIKCDNQIEGRGHYQLSPSLCRQVWSAVNRLDATPYRLNQLLIALVHRVGCTLNENVARKYSKHFWTRHLWRREQPLYQRDHTIQ